MNHYGRTEKLYSITEAASELNIAEMGLQHLYFYLRELNILHQNRKPFTEYLALGYFKINYGTRNKFQDWRFLTPRVTEKGLRWLKQEIRPQILELHKKYFLEV